MMASRVMSRLVTPEAFSILKGWIICTVNPITYWTSLQLIFFDGGHVFLWLGLVGSKLPQAKMHRWIGCLMDLLVSIPGHF